MDGEYLEDVVIVITSNHYPLQAPATCVSGGNNWSAFPQSVQPSNGVSDSQSWNILMSSAAPIPPNPSQNVQPDHAATKPPLHGQGQQPTGTTQNGRNEIPEGSMPYYHPPSKSTNPFDIAGELPATQRSTINVWLNALSFHAYVDIQYESKFEVEVDLVLSFHANACQWFEIKKKQATKQEKTIAAHAKDFKDAAKKTQQKLP